MNVCDAGTAWWRPEREAAPTSVEGETSRAAFVGLVVFTVILLLAPQTVIPALKALRIAFLAAAVAIGGHILDATMRRRPIVPAGTEIAVALTLLCWAVLTVPFSYWPGGSVALLTDQYLKALVFFWLICTLITSRDRLRTFGWALTLSAIPLAGMAIKHYLAGDFLFTGTSAVKRISGYSGLSGNPNDLALTLNLLIPIAGAILLTTRSVLGKVASGFALLLSIPAVIVTFSRAGFLTLGAIALAGLIFMVRRRAIGGAVALLALSLSVVPLLPDGYVERLSTIVDIEADPTGSAQGRWTDFQVATTVVAQNPVLGVGLGQDILALNEARGRATWRSVHNAYLEYAVDLGLPGILLFLWLLVASFATARRVERYTVRKPMQRDVSIFAAGVQIALLAFAVAAFFHPIAYQFYFFCVAGLAVAVKNVCRAEAVQSSMQAAA